MKCAFCGNEIPDFSIFCDQCGYKMQGTDPNTLIVSPDGFSLTEAIEKVPENGAICLKKGTYNVNLEIKKSITIYAESQKLGETVIALNNSAVSINSGAKVVVKGIVFNGLNSVSSIISVNRKKSDLKISEFVAENCFFVGRHTSILSGESKIVMENCTIDGNLDENLNLQGLFGIYSSKSKVVLKNTAIRNMKEGFFIENSNGISVENCIFENCETGINIESSSKNDEFSNIQFINVKKNIKKPIFCSATFR